MRQVIRRQHKALSTEDCYIFWLRRYMTALRQMPANLTSEKKLEQFLTDLPLRCDVAASTQNQALHSILYFYKFVLEQPLANVDALRATEPYRDQTRSQKRHEPLLWNKRANPKGNSPADSDPRYGPVTATIFPLPRLTVRLATGTKRGEHLQRVHSCHRRPHAKWHTNRGSGGFCDARLVTW
jgi:hypothetical protein